MKYLLSIILFCLLAVPAFAKVELIVPAKPATNPNDVVISMYDRGQFKNCEEMGIAHNRNDFGVWQTKKGMFKRMKKQVADVGGTHVLVQDTTTRGVQQSTAVVFYCAKK